MSDNISEGQGCRRYYARLGLQYLDPYWLICLCFSIPAFFYALHFSMHPRYSWWGDEYAHYEAARWFVTSGEWTPFYRPGVYGENSALLSYYPAVFLYLFGLSVDVWRAGFLFLLIPGSILIYSLGRQVASRSVGLAAAALFCTSFYVHNFFTIGYPNALSPIYLLILLNYFMRLVSGRAVGYGYIIIGAVITGLSAYIYAGPIMPAMIAPFLVCYRWNDRSDNTRQQMIIFLFLALLVCLPGFLCGTSLNEGVLGRLGDFSGFDWTSRLKNGLLGFTGFLGSPNIGQFVKGSYLDAISAVLCGIGMIATFASCRRVPPLLILLSYVLACFCLGLSNGDNGIPFSRALLLLPYLFIFAGWGAVVCLNVLPRRAKWIFVITLAILIPLANRERQERFFRDTGVSDLSCILWEVVEEKQKNPELHEVVIQAQREFATNFLKEVFEFYRVGEIEVSIVSPHDPVTTTANSLVVNLASLDAGRCRHKTPASRFPGLPESLTNFQW